MFTFLLIYYYRKIWCKSATFALEAFFFERDHNRRFVTTYIANDDLLLVIPPLSRNCSNTFFERSFNFAAPTEWNRLDKRIQRISNLNTFKSEIRTILFLNYFDV